MSECCPFVLISEYIFFRELRSANFGERIEKASEPTADTPLSPPRCLLFAVLFKFSESDERHSCFNSSAKGTARLSALWIGFAYRTQSLSELFACSRFALSSPAALFGGNA